MEFDSSTDTSVAAPQDEEERDEKDRRRSGAIVIAIIVALLILWWILTQTTVVPNLKGMTESQARRSLRGASLMTGDVTEARSTEVPVGRVVDQAPFGGLRVLKGSEVDFATSKGGLGVSGNGTGGPPEEQGFALSSDEIDSGSRLRDQESKRTTFVAQYVPMVQALKRDAAVLTLRLAGYRTRVKYGPVTTGPGKGKVYFQDPEPYAVEPRGTLVEIWVSTGGPTPKQTPYYPKPLPSP
jgi:hypothetical protein